MPPTKLRFIWQSSFREDFLEIEQSETRIAWGGHVFWRIGMKWAIFIQDLPRMLPTKFQFIWESGFRGEFKKTPTEQKQELPVVAMFVNILERNEQSMHPTKF